MFFKKRARTRRAYFIHGKVDDGPVLKAHILGILSADFEYGVGFRAEESGCLNVTGYFVADDVGAEELAGHIAPRARRPGALNDNLAFKFLTDFIKSLLHRFDRLAGGH